MTLATDSSTSTRSVSIMDSYFSGLSDETLLTAAEERSLAEAKDLGDVSARGRMIRANLRLVVRIAREFQGRGLSLDDLVGEGNLGLIRAVDQFDPRFGVRFVTYASHWIKQAIREAVIKTASTIRLPNHMFGLLTLWRRTERSLARSLGREPHFEEVCDALGLTDARRAMVAHARRTRRILTEATLDDPEGASLALEAPDSREPDHGDLETREQIQAMRDRLDQLDPRERSVIFLRFGLDGRHPLTLREVGTRLGITREWVRKIEQRALSKLGPSSPRTTRTDSPTRSTPLGLRTRTA